MSLVYAIIPFLNILFTYGLETAYFKFVQNKEIEKDVYDTVTVSLIISTISLTILLLLFRHAFADLLRIKEHPEYITYSAFIIAFDALTTIAFARLRHEGRPIKYAVIRIAGILINIIITVFFLSVCPRLLADNPNSFVQVFYNEKNGVGYVILANLVQSVATFFFLSKEFFAFRWRFNASLWKQIMIYSLPLLVAGFGGMINETFDRIMLGLWSTADVPKLQVGIYSACYKLSILITLFITAFRMGAEPFFFKQAQSDNPQKTYARVMKIFVIVICFMFLVVALFLDIWKYFLKNPVLWEGLKVVPILLLANMFLGIYYNLAIWYKLTHKTMAGAWITLIGAAITLLINYFFIPQFDYMACAWATFFSYGTMMVISYIWGQKYYRIPYAWKKLIAYIVIVVLLYFVHRLFLFLDLGVWPNRALGIILLSVFGLLILRVERKEIQRLPVVGRYF
jgi:Membrane protein involved in the export of O-antigen and teichoic acid